MKSYKIIGAIIGVMAVLTLGGLGIYYLVNKSDGNWVCYDGQWVKDGNPSSPPPLTPCLKEEKVGMANPASEHCVKEGGVLEIRKNILGEEYGVCLFENEVECEEWALFRGECSKTGEISHGKRYGAETILIRPGETELIGNTVEVVGEMPGNWYFEAVAQVEIWDSAGRLLGHGLALAETDWMVTSSVAFKTKIEVATTTAATGTIIFKNDNPTGLPEYDKSESYPIVFGNPITLYFGSNELDRDHLDCTKVFPVYRVVDKKEVEYIQFALEELLKGPSPEELAAKYFTAINNGVEINSLKGEGNKMTVDFSEKLQEMVGGSCRVTMIRSQIENTLKQFNEIEVVEIAINGQVDDILQP